MPVRDEMVPFRLGPSEWQQLDYYCTMLLEVYPATAKLSSIWERFSPKVLLVGESETQLQRNVKGRKSSNWYGIWKVPLGIDHDNLKAMTGLISMRSPDNNCSSRNGCCRYRTRHNEWTVMPESALCGHATTTVPAEWDAGWFRKWLKKNNLAGIGSMRSPHTKSSSRKRFWRFQKWHNESIIIMDQERPIVWFSLIPYLTGTVLEFWQLWDWRFALIFNILLLYRSLR